MPEPSPRADPAPLTCPFCGGELTDRVTIEGESFLVFRCMFTPRYDPTMSEAEIAQALRAAHAGPSSAYFRGVCDRLHLYVTKGEGARWLAPPPGPTDG